MKEMRVLLVPSENIEKGKWLHPSYLESFVSKEEAIVITNMLNVIITSTLINPSIQNFEDLTSK